MTGVGIESAGVAIPYHRVSTADIHGTWGNIPEGVLQAQGVVERVVADPDGDTLTLAAEAAIRALDRAGGGRVDAVILGTQTGPYLTRSGAAIVADMLGVGPAVFATDVQFAGRSGTAALLLASAWVAAGFGERAIAIGADTLGPHVAPGDPQEYTAGAGAAAFVLSADAALATMDAHGSSASDTADGYRPDGERYLRTTGTVMSATDVGYPDHARIALAALRDRHHLPAEDVARLVTQQPDAATPGRIAKKLSLAPQAVVGTVLADRIGDAGAASPLLGLVRALEASSRGERILVVSYGVGAGCDAIALTATADQPSLGLEQEIARGRTVPYATAVRYERRYDGHERLIGTFE